MKLCAATVMAFWIRDRVASDYEIRDIADPIQTKNETKSVPHPRQ
jgi:hypothetical protein